MQISTTQLDDTTRELTFSFDEDSQARVHVEVTEGIPTIGDMRFDRTFRDISSFKVSIPLEEVINENEDRIDTLRPETVDPEDYPEEVPREDYQRGATQEAAHTTAEAIRRAIHTVSPPSI